MRILFLALLIALPSFAGCFNDDRQWAGIAEAWQYRDSALVEIQLHRGSPGGAATTDTARAGMGQVVAIENATATMEARDGRTIHANVTDWILDRENDTARAALPIARFDGFRLNATFVLRDGTRLNTGELASWSEQYRRPFYSTLRVTPRQTNTTLTLSILELETGARDLIVGSLAENGTLTAVNITRLDTWSVSIENATGKFEDAAPPTLGRQTISVTIPSTGLTRAEPHYTVVLDNGFVLSDRDVDNDVYPESLALQQRVRQEN